MISLFLVEDERIARESIRDNVPWQEHDILFLGDAPDGEVALPQLLEKRPDILLTDIKMPFMDGLELARIVRKELPDTRIIILSGHNEFEYARKAITLGVNDYLLKPVSSRDILEAVDRSKAQILECRARRIERQSHSITQRELFFSNLYSGILMGPAQMLQRAAQLGISLAAGAYQIILTELDGVIPDREALRDKLYAAPMAYGSGFDGERATFLLLAEDAAGLPPKLREFSAWLEALAGQEGLSVHLLPGKQAARLSDLPSPQTARRCPTPPPSSGTPCWTFCGLGSRLHFRHFGPTTGRPSSPGIPPLSIAAISIQSFSLWSMSSARKTGSPFRNPCARRICWKSVFC